MRISKALFMQLTHGVTDSDTEVERGEEQTGKEPLSPLRPALPLLLVPLFCTYLGLLCGERIIASGGLGAMAGTGAVPVSGVELRVSTQYLFSEPSGFFEQIATALRESGVIELLMKGALPLLLLIAAVALLLIICNKSFLKKVIALSLCALLGGSILGLHYWGGVLENAEVLLSSNESRVLVTITNDPTHGSFSSSSIAEVRLDNGSRERVRVQWPSNEEPLPQGMQFTAAIVFSELKERDLYLFEQGICGSVTLRDCSEAAFRPDIIGTIDSFRARNVALLGEIGGEGAALMCGVLLGNTEELKGSATEQSFRVTGLAHLIAVSGSHLVVIASLLGWALSKLPGRRSLEILLLVFVLALYVILTGFQPSAIRAAVMGALSSFSFFAHRRAHTPSALCAAALGMLLMYPPNTFSAGFWLSVCAVIGISLFCPLVQSWFAAIAHETGAGIRGIALWVKGRVSISRLPQRKKGLCLRLPQSIMKTLYNGPRSTVSILALTCTAQGATLPIAVPLFSILPLVSPLANAIITPFVSVMIGGGMVAICLGLLLPQPAHVLLTALCQLGEGVSWASGKLAAIPYAALPQSFELVPALMIACSLAVLLYVVWPRPSHKTAIKMLLVITILPLSAFVVSSNLTPSQLIMLDVGQGDALIIREGRHTVLVDTGPSRTAILKALARHHITHIDAVVITHLDTDHCGALGALQGIVQVDYVFFAEDVPSAQSTDKTIETARALVGESRLKTLQLHDSIPLSRHLTLELVWPDRPVETSENADSICLMVYFDVEGDGIPEHDALLTGDAESAELASMLEERLITTCEILKVGHHGSRASLTYEQLTQLEVEVALISAGLNNRYGHPADTILSALEEAKVSVFRTDLHGDVILTFSALALKVQYATIQ